MDMVFPLKQRYASSSFQQKKGRFVVNYWQRFYNWVVPPQLQQQIEKQTQINILVGVFSGNIIICLLTMVFLITFLSIPIHLQIIAFVLTGIPIVMYAIALLVLRQKSSIVWATNVAVVGLFLEDFAAVVITGGYSHSPFVGLFILPPLLSFLLAGQRSGIFWSVVALATQIMLVIVESSGWLTLDSLVDDANSFLLQLAMPIILSSMLGIALYIFERINAGLRHKLIGANAVLENHSHILDQQNRDIGLSNKELERSKQILLQKSRELEASGRYKSEFLSTMSHELRTPLNSILILSKALMDNRAGRLGAKEVEHASVVYSAGTDLLNLINDILDLSKVEEGKLDLVYEKIPLKDIEKELTRQFRFVAENKGLDFSVQIARDLPDAIDVDIHRLSQILKNFISNALKFTSKGGIYIDIFRPQSPFISLEPGLSENKAIVIAVRDTGTGIPKNKQEIIFEAFKQADGTTARKYGGTGLGLTISRQLAGLMKGEISVYSAGEGMGSTFGFILPVNAPDSIQATELKNNAPTAPAQPKTHEASPVESAEFILAQPCEKILIVEDDKKFATILLDLIIEEKLGCDIVYSGEDCIAYLKQFVPSAIILDLSLPDMNGWEVLKKIKASQQLKNIPIRIVSAMPEQKRAQAMGVVDFIEKPASQSVIHEMLLAIKNEIAGSFKNILIIEDSVELHSIIREQFEEYGLGVQFAETGKEALLLMKQHSFDCFIVDLNLPDYKGIDLLKEIRATESKDDKPIIVFTAMTLTAEKEFEISRYADRIIVKAPRALEHLVEATGLFLQHLQQPISTTPEIPGAESVSTAEKEKPQTGVVSDKDENNAGTDSSFAPLREYIAFQPDGLEGCKVLLVDDDIRNVYSMSAVLDSLGVVVTVATSGVEALQKLTDSKDLQLVLMDIMMPEMDGYEATRRIRKMNDYAAVPVIALTAKAMPEDRKLCLDAGANDYVTKPVDTEHLKRVMYTWLMETK